MGGWWNFHSREVPRAARMHAACAATETVVPGAVQMPFSVSLFSRAARPFVPSAPMSGDPLLPHHTGGAAQASKASFGWRGSAGFFLFAVAVVAAAFV